jgi:3-deoxy-D-manno-octulosonate 8-phosphate phosphatase (KDO 8-P phosphatase)
LKTSKKADLKKKLQKIKAFLTDVDGVLTDGGMYYGPEGLVMKKYFVRDGMGSVVLQRAGIETGMITSDTSPIGRARAERLKFDHIYIGIRDKCEALDEICAKKNYTYENIAFIGDDINDIEILKRTGFSAAPADAIDEVKKVVDYVCAKKGGEGAYREVVDMIMKAQKKKIEYIQTNKL